MAYEIWKVLKYNFWKLAMCYNKIKKNNLMYDIIMPIGSYDSLLPKSIKSAVNQTLNYENFQFVFQSYQYLKHYHK